MVLQVRLARRSGRPARALPRLRDHLWSLLLVTLVLLTYARARPALIDDAYISFRYAEQMTRGNGLVLNPGEHVEGATNALWTLLLAVPQRLGVSIVISAAVLGLLCVTAAVLLTVRLARLMGLPSPAALACGAAVALSTQTVAAATMGLETGLFGALLLAALLAAHHQRPVGLGLALLGLAATRPEGLVLGLVFAVLVLALGEQPLPRRAWTAAAGGTAVAAVEILRYAYYGALLPNSVLAKRDVGFSLISSLLRHGPDGLAYLAHSFTFSALVLLVVTVVGLWACRRGIRPSWWRHRPPVLLTALIAAAALGLGLPILSGGDWMPYARLITPYLPLMVVLVALVTQAAFGEASSRSTAAVVLAPLLLVALAPRPAVLHDGGASPLSAARPYDNVGRALESMHLGDRVVAADVLGRISFWAPDVRFTDPLGLNEPRVAATAERSSVFGKKNPQVTADRRPAVFASNFWAGMDGLYDACHARGQDFVAVTSPALTDDRVFLLVEQQWAARLAEAVRPYYGSVVIESYEQALSQWRARLPDGQ